MTQTPQAPKKSVNLAGVPQSAIINIPDDAIELNGAVAASASEPNPVSLDLMPPNPDAKGPWIAYTGLATLREISKSDWAKVGVNDQGAVEWNILNGYKISVSDLSEKAIDYCLRVDGRFSKVDE